MNGKTPSTRHARAVGRRRQAVSARLIPVPPPPDAPSHYPFGAYPFLYRLPGGRGFVKVFVDYRFEDPRLDNASGAYIDEDHDAPLGEDGPRIVELARGVGAKLIVRCGPGGWLVYSLPFTGVRWTTAGDLLDVEIDAEERLRNWLSYVERRAPLRIKAPK